MWKKLQDFPFTASPPDLIFISPSVTNWPYLVAWPQDFILYRRPPASPPKQTTWLSGQATGFRWRRRECGQQSGHGRRRGGANPLRHATLNSASDFPPSTADGLKPRRVWHFDSSHSHLCFFTLRQRGYAVYMWYGCNPGTRYCLHICYQRVLWY